MSGLALSFRHGRSADLELKFAGGEEQRQVPFEAGRDDGLDRK
jgi:hypothetical protein